MFICLIFNKTLYTKYGNIFVVHSRPKFHITSKGKVNPITGNKATDK
jgi:hypothetical protein